MASYEKGVCYAELSALRLQVWALKQPDDGQQLGWTLVHDANLEPHIRTMQTNSRARQPRMEWEMVGSSKTVGLFRQKDETTNGVDDEEVEGQDTNGDENNNLVVEKDNEVEMVLSTRGTRTRITSSK